MFSHAFIAFRFRLKSAIRKRTRSIS